MNAHVHEMATCSRSSLEGNPALLFQPERQPPKEKRFRMEVVSEYEPAGDQPTAIRELSEGVGKSERSGSAWRNWFGQNLHHGQGHRGHAEAHAHSCA